MGRLLHLLVRRQVLEEPPTKSPEVILRSTLTTASGSTKSIKNDYRNIDLLAISINCAFALAFYAIIGFLTVQYAGPASVISIIVAAFAAILAGFCYVEFSSRIRQEGSSYLYSYVCLGELVAFIVGWTCILKIITSIASLSRGVTYILNSLSNDCIISAFISILVMDIPYISRFIDFIALIFPVFLAIILLIANTIPKRREFSIIYACINLILGFIIIIMAALKLNTSNWELNGLNGGFFPFGYKSVLNALPISMCAFVSIEFLAMIPKGYRHIDANIFNPLFFSIIIIAILTGSAAIFSTLIIPLDQIRFGNEPINILLALFWHISVWQKWFVAVSGLIAIAGSVYFIMEPLPKLLSKMVDDALLFKFFGYGHSSNKAISGTFIIALITGIFGAFLSATLLLNLLSLTILISYTAVILSVLVLRYTDGRIQKEEYLPSELKSNSVSNLIVCENPFTFDDYWKQFFNYNKVRAPTPVTSFLVKINSIVFCLLSLILNSCFIFGEEMIFINGELWLIIVASVLIGLIAVFLISIGLQPEEKRDLTFKVPLMPTLPAISIFINIYIMLRLDYQIWISFLIWIVSGLSIYFTCLKIYERSDQKSTFTLNRETLNGKMHFAYDNEIYFEEASPLPEDNLTLHKNTFTIKDFKTFKHMDETIQVQADDEINQPEEIVPDEEKSFHEDRISNATYVIAMLDEVLSNESAEPDDDFNVSGKMSIETESIHSIHLNMEHFAMVHQEDDRNSEENDVIGDIPSLTLPDTYEPKTPNVSRAESFMNVENIPETEKFADKLNQLLQEQLQADKPNRIGLYKPENIGDENQQEMKPSPENNSLLAQIHKELRERKKLNPTEINQKKQIDKKPTNIRDQLEKILQSGPQNPEQMTLRKSNAAKAVNHLENVEKIQTNETHNDEDPNNSSVLALQLRTARKTLAQKPVDSGIDSGNSSTLSIEEPITIEEETSPQSAQSIRTKLNEILRIGPRHPSQIGLKKHLSEPSLLPNRELSVNELNESINHVNDAEPLERRSKTYSKETAKKILDSDQQRPISKTYSKETSKQFQDNQDNQMTLHKSLMGNVFKSIELRRNSSGRNEGRFLQALKDENERAKQRKDLINNNNQNVQQ